MGEGKCSGPEAHIEMLPFKSPSACQNLTTTMQARDNHERTMACHHHGFRSLCFNCAPARGEAVEHAAVEQSGQREGSSGHLDRFVTSLLG